MPALFLTEPLRRLERAALADLPPGTLMARAAAAVADATSHLARGFARGRPVLALVGPGNNGGDALLAALSLRERGYACRALALHAQAPSGGDAADAWRQAREAGLRIDGIDTLGPALAGAPIVIDGLFGIGLDRPLEGDAAALCDAVAQAALPVVAVDVPSGIDADTGAVVGGQGRPAMRARCTVTMIADKPGLHTGAALDHVGTVMVAALGLEGRAATRPGDPGIGELFTADRVAGALPRRARDSNKGSFGTVLAYGGDAGMRGAVLLAARGAQVMGAGKVYVGTPAGDPFDAGQPQLMSAPAEPDFAAYDAVAIGCGLGQSARARVRVAAALANAPAVVLDADALNLLAAEPALVDAPRATPADARRLMTPHPLEAARLLGTDAGAVQVDRRGAALALARRYRMTVLLKGAGSIVATPEGSWSIIDAGSPALASAGTGDVLAGMIAALLARGEAPARAACVAAWLHGEAGARWEARAGHAEGLSAAELPRHVRAALGARGAGTIAG